MLEAEFDQFAREYQEQHAASIRLSGEAPEFFHKYKID
ncbi:MAG: class I SAM-dependent methyltransferase, partial [Mesorhizobium sp.]